MDASDIIRKIQAKTIYTNYKTTLSVREPTCNFSTCGAASVTCTLNYPDYAERYNVLYGKAYCSSCQVICGFGDGR
jgi:hypothetical protein